MYHILHSSMNMLNTVIWKPPTRRYRRTLARSLYTDGKLLCESLISSSNVNPFDNCYSWCAVQRGNVWIRTANLHEDGHADYSVVLITWSPYARLARAWSSIGYHYSWLWTVSTWCLKIGECDWACLGAKAFEEGPRNESVQMPLESLYWRIKAKGKLLLDHLI